MGLGKRILMTQNSAVSGGMVVHLYVSEGEGVTGIHLSSGLSSCLTWSTKMGLCGLETQMPPLQRELKRSSLPEEPSIIPPSDFTAMIFMAQPSSEHLHISFFYLSV